MRDEHIIEVLDNVPLANLSEAELIAIRTHVRQCVSCRESYEAAQLSSLMIKERVQAVVEPSPFFQTKVLAALREQQATESVPALWRLWKSASAVISSMAVTTAALAALSFMVPASSTPGVEQQTASVYSAESVIFDQGNDEQMTYEQVLNTIYSDEDEAK
jgi:predicted anti-sigma-YlaC factor YlaD